MSAWHFGQRNGLATGWLLKVKWPTNAHMAADLTGLDHEFSGRGPMEALPLSAVGGDFWRWREAGSTLVGATLRAFELKGEFGKFLQSTNLNN